LIGLRFIENMPRRAYAAERITVLFVAIFLISRMELFHYSPPPVDERSELTCSLP
jgi:hypothetical protein